MSKDTNGEGIPVSYDAPERDGWVRRPPWPVDDDGHPIRDEHQEQPETLTPREGDVTAAHDDDPNRRRLMWATLAVLAALLLALVLWAVLDGTKGSTSTQKPAEAKPSASSSADPVAVKNAIAYQTAWFAGPREAACKLDADAASCRNVAEISKNDPTVGLTKPITSVKTAHVAGTPGNSDAALPDNGTAGVTVVLVEIHAKNQPATQYEAVAVRDSDHKIIGTETVNDDNRSLSLETIGQQIIDKAGQ